MNKSLFNFSILTVAAAVLTLSSASVLKSIPPHLLNEQLNLQENSYFVLFHSAPGTSEAKAEQENFREQARAAGIKLRERFSFKLVNALSFDATKDELKLLQEHDAIKAIYPMLSHRPPKVIAARNDKTPKLKFAHSITGVAEAHSMGFTGKGIKVGIIDSGIDYMHPALGGGFGKGFKVAYGYDFVGDNYKGNNTAVPDNDPRTTCDGHGTHVAGIVAAKDKDFTGVAPEATLGAYRIFGCGGPTATDIIIRAMERAYEDGMDVINMSLGAGSSFAEYPDALAADELVKKGVVVLAAGGNDGEKGMWQAESPGLGNDVFGVASFDNNKFMSYGFSVGDAPHFSYTSGNETFFLDLPTNTPIARYLDENGADLACQPVPGLNLSGRVALIQRGSCNFSAKVLNAQNANALAVVVYNNQFGGLAPSVSEEPKIKIPIVAITQADGQRLLKLLKDGPQYADWKKNPEVFDTPTGGKISDFSSWGPSPSLKLKPDLGAPGGLIYSTWPIALGSYSTISGTSMATPYLSGSVALFLEAKGKTNGVLIRNRFKNTANPTMTWDGEATTSVFRQGGGLVNVKAALTTETTVTPAELALNSTDSSGPKVTRQLTIQNWSKYPRKYELSNRPACSVQAWNLETEELLAVPVSKNSYPSAEFSANKFVLAPGKSTTVSVTITPPEDLEENQRWLYSGFILVEAIPTVDDDSDHEIPVSVPYGGMKGAFRSVNVLPKPGSDLPALLAGNDQSVVTKPVTFTMKGTDFPIIAFKLMFPCRKIKIVVLNEAGKELGTITDGEAQFLGQNDSTGENTSDMTPWDGTFTPGKKPSAGRGKGSDARVVKALDGVYSLRLYALKPLGQEENPKDYETWNSVQFTISRSGRGGHNADDESGTSDGAGKVTLKQIQAKLVREGAAELEKATKLAQSSAEPHKLVLKKELS